MLPLTAARFLPKPPVAKGSSTPNISGLADELSDIGSAASQGARWLFDNSPLGVAIGSSNMPNKYKSETADAPGDEYDEWITRSRLNGIEPSATDKAARKREIAAQGAQTGGRSMPDDVRSKLDEMLQRSVGVGGVSAPEPGESGFVDAEAKRYETPALSAADFLPYPGFSAAEPLSKIPAFPTEQGGIEDSTYENPFPTDVDDNGIMHIIKEKGGNWMHRKDAFDSGFGEPNGMVASEDPVKLELDKQKAGAHYSQSTDIWSPEKEMSHVEEASDKDMEQYGITHRNTYSGEGYTPEKYQSLLKQANWNIWVDKKLGKYIRNEMGTVNDPVRKKIEETGRTHINNIENMEADILRDDGQWETDLPSLQQERETFGYDFYGSGNTPLSRAWETIADNGISVVEKGPYTQPPAPKWFSDLPDETPLYALYNGALDDIGIRHVRDEVQNAMAEDSGLPQNLQIKPNKLLKMNVADVFDHVAGIDEWRIANRKAAPIAMTMEADIAKDYPEDGYRWIELNRSGQFSAESDALSHSVRGYEPSAEGGYERYGVLEGGFSDIEAGRIKMYSLRDTDTGKSLATIETSLAAPASVEDELNRIGDQHQDLKTPWERREQWILDNPDKMIHRIHQVKGLSNGKPDDEAIPMIQDFIRSLPNVRFGKSGYDVGAGKGDIRHTDLLRIGEDPEIDLIAKILNDPDTGIDTGYATSKGVGMSDLVFSVWEQLTNTSTDGFTTGNEIMDIAQEILMETYR
jgi:hypothetical protein